MDAFVGEIRMFPYNFAPVDWQDCDGTLLSIAAYQSLFQLIGTTYGGDGVNNFAVPDLRGRIPLHQGAGIGLTPRLLGQAAGNESVTLTLQQMPAHNHMWTATSAVATAGAPTGSVELGAVTAPNTAYTGTITSLSPVAFATNAVGMMGGNQAHDNMMPTMTLRYCIATQGTYPSPA